MERSMGKQILLIYKIYEYKYVNGQIITDQSKINMDRSYTDTKYAKFLFF